MNFADDPLIAGQVTFTIVSRGSPGEDRSWGVNVWAKNLLVHPMRGYSLENATSFSLYGGGDECLGSRTCTYTTYDTNVSPGWYAAGDQNGLGGPVLCWFTFKWICGEYPSSGSAFYVPEEDDAEDPYVEIATTGSGLTTKAIAQAVDPRGDPITLVWDFGDGITQSGSLGSVVTHEYSAPGKYVVTAFVTTPDGRSHSASSSARLDIPKPILQAVARHPGGFTPTGVAAGTLQGWPSGARAHVRYWTDGCPANPSDVWQSSPGSSNEINVQADGTVSMPFNWLAQAGDNQYDANANAFMMIAEGELEFTDTVVPIVGLGDCIEMEPTLAYQTTSAVAAGATEVPVDSASVPVGNIAVVGAGLRSGLDDLSEQRLVNGHGSLLVSALLRDLPADSYVIDAGTPLQPYSFAGPPEDPVLEPFDTGAGEPPTDPGVDTGDCRTDAITLNAPVNSGSQTARSEISIQVTGGVSVASGATLELSAPRIGFEPGFRVEQGGQLRAIAAPVSCTAAAVTSTQRAAASSAGATSATASAPVTLLAPAFIAGLEALPRWLQEHLLGYGIESEALSGGLLDGEERWLILQTTQALHPGDDNEVSDLYRLDLLSDEFRLISVTEAGTAGNGPSRDPAADANGERVVFTSDASDLVPGDANGVSDLFLRDLALDFTERLTLVEQASAHPALDAEGMLLVYDQTREAGPRQILGQALADGAAAEVVALSAAGAWTDAHHPALSADGRYLAYLRQLANRDGSLVCSVEIRDLVTDVSASQTCPAALAATTDPGRAMFSPDAHDLSWSLSGQTSPITLVNPLQPLSCNRAGRAPARAHSPDRSQLLAPAQESPDLADAERVLAAGGAYKVCSLAIKGLERRLDGQGGLRKTRSARATGAPDCS
ncbi:PKD domain-containing protein [Allochromatium palmeri]|nr:PKD domain-containing protein [Allochromatium palmeri]